MHNKTKKITGDHENYTRNFGKKFINIFFYYAEGIRNKMKKCVNIT